MNAQFSVNYSSKTKKYEVYDNNEIRVASFDEETKAIRYVNHIEKLLKSTNSYK